MITEKKATGFASPTQGYEEQGIDLNEMLIQNPPATYFGRLDTGEMEQLGLPRGTLLIIDRSKKPSHGDFVMLRHEGQFLCRLILLKENNTIKGNTIKGNINKKTTFTNGIKAITPIDDETEIIGVVTASIKQYGTSTGSESFEPEVFQEQDYDFPY
jgi:DNA polymerase V